MNHKIRNILNRNAQENITTWCEYEYEYVKGYK